MPDFQAEFDRGLDAARDEAGASALDKGASARTTLRSPWFHGKCPLCRHTFRVDDMVKRSGNSITHAGGELNCVHDAEFNISTSAIDFFAGLDETWPPPDNVRVTRLEPSHYLVAPPVTAVRRRTCFVCTHTFRPFDQVVICPCRPFEPQCEVAVHRDPVHGLLCYETWNPGSTRTHCPVTSRKL
jgi:hypothetical protein